MENFIQEVKVLDDYEVDMLNDFVSTKIFHPNTVFPTEGALQSSLSDYRTSTGTSLSDDTLVSEIIDKRLDHSLLVYKSILLSTNSALNAFPLPETNGMQFSREGMQVLEYTETQQYQWHYDACTHPDNPYYHRQISVVLYLTDDFEGGKTKFLCGGKEYKPKKGHALIFPSNWCFAHCATPVISGKKRVLVTWYQCSPNKG